MALPVTITGISTAVACVGPYKGHGPVISQTAGSSAQAVGDASGSERAGQSFTVGASDIVCTAVKLNLFKNGAPTDNAIIELFVVDGSGLPTGSALASAIVAGTSLGSGNASGLFVLSVSATLTASTQYALTLRRDGAIDASNFYRLQWSTTSQITGGNNLLYNGSWSNGSGDLLFGIQQDAFYFFGRDGTTATTLQAFKATDPTSSFASAATKTGFTTAITNLSGYQVSDVIHQTVCDGTLASSLNQKYQTFDMSSDTFVTAETIASGLATAGQTGAGQPNASIVVRSNGNAVAFFNGAQTKKSGTNYARVYWSERTGVNTWSAAALVCVEDANDHLAANASLGTSDRVHFHWFVGSNFNERSLSSANALDTLQTASNWANFSVGGISYDDGGGTYKVLKSGSASNSNVKFYTSGASPSVSTSTAINTITAPTRLFVDTGDSNKVYAVMRDGGASNDLNINSSTDDGSTWGTAASFFTGTVANVDTDFSRDGNIYQQGSNFVIPYVVNDNGTLKYNEYAVRSSATAWAGSAAPSITLAMTATAALRMLASSSLPVSFNLAANAEIKPLRATALLAIQTDLIANAVRYSPISAAPSLVTSLAANALRFTPTTSLLAVSTDLTAAARQLMAAQSVQPVAFNMAAAALRFTNATAAPQVSFDLSAATIQRLAGLATLPVELSVIAAPVQRMVARAVLPVSFDLIANPTVQGPAGQLIQMTAALAVTLNLSANAVRYTPTAAVLAASTELIANAVRYSPVSASPSVVLSMAAATTQLMAGLSAQPVTLNLSAAAKQLMAAASTQPVVLNVAANAVRYTPTTALLAVEVSLAASARQRLAALSAQPIVLNMTAAPVQRMRAQATASVVFGMAAFATIAGQATQWPGSAAFSAVFSLSASTTQLMAARSTQAASFALAATANLIAQARAQADVVTSLSASARLLLSAQASMAVETAMRVDAKARLAAYAGAMVELSMDARVVALSSMSSIATAEFGLIARVGLTMPVLAEMGAAFDLLADAEVKFLSPIQSITVLRGVANRGQSIDGIARTGQVIRGVARRSDEL